MIFLSLWLLSWIVLISNLSVNCFASFIMSGFLILPKPTSHTHLSKQNKDQEVCCSSDIGWSRFAPKIQVTTNLFQATNKSTYPLFLFLKMKFQSFLSHDIFGHGCMLLMIFFLFFGFLCYPCWFFRWLWLVIDGIMYPEWFLYWLFRNPWPIWGIGYFNGAVCCQTRISKEWSPICLKETNNYVRWWSSTLL